MFENAPSFVEFAGELYFAANDGTNGNQIWKTTGEQRETTQVDLKYDQRFLDSNLPANPSELTVVGDSLYFLTTRSGTNTVWKLAENSDEPAAVWQTLGTSRIYNVSGQLFFTGASQLTGEETLWTSDGTDVGTISLKRNLRPNTPISILGSEIFFTASDVAHGEELWKSDGTSLGTIMVHDLAPVLHRRPFLRLKQ